MAKSIIYCLLALGMVFFQSAPAAVPKSNQTETDIAGQPAAEDSEYPSATTEDSADPSAATETAAGESQIAYQDEQFTITYDRVECINWGNENEFDFYFTAENKSSSDIVVSCVNPVINDYPLYFGYSEISVPAGETVNQYVGFADHDYQGTPDYTEWLNQVIDNGLQTLSISFTIKNANSDVIVDTPVAELLL